MHIVTIKAFYFFSFVIGYLIRQVMKETKSKFLQTFNKVSIKHLQGGTGMHFRPFEVTINTR